MRLRYTAIAILSILFSAACSQELADVNAISQAKGLVIKADCSTVTKTDIVEGKSTWEAGDEITVVYDGTAYNYKTETAGAQATFTSEAGISSYDASKSLVAYYPATTADGTISVASERSIEFQGTEQANAACAPLVGTPNEGNLSGGVLKVGFRNICSVIELKIDAGSLTSKAKSLTIEPASTDGFSGYISFTGTVDPSTLAITTTSTGNILKLNLPEGTDLTQAQTLKFPVGRFKSESGIKVTLETADGFTYTKNIYKSGIETYSEVSGKYSVRHLAKAMYAFSKGGGGIWSAADLIDFANAVNSGGDLISWTDDSGNIALLDDIDMTGVTDWTPIGSAAFQLSSNVLSVVSGKTFNGHFDGKDHSISNFKMVCSNATAGAAWGLFGGLSAGAVVENLTFDSSCSLTVSPSEQTDCGILAGVAWDATVRNITNNAALTYKDAAVADNKRMTMAMIGLAFATSKTAVIDDLVNNGAISGDSGNNKKNGATSVQVAGICGFSSNDAASSDKVEFTNCENNGDINSSTGRASGLVASCNRYTNLTDCTNNGDNFNNFAIVGSGRIGNVTCITGTGCVFTRVVNKGDLVCDNEGAAGGILCLVNADDNQFISCESYGKVVTDKTTYAGAFFGQCNKAAVFTDCVSHGDFGTYNKGAYVLVGTNADNYFDYVGTHSAAAVNVTKENITYSAAAPASATFGVTPASATLASNGTEYVALRLSAKDYDWTVSDDASWLSVTDLSKAEVSSGVKSDEVCKLRLYATMNSSESSRKATVTFKSADNSQNATVEVTQSASLPSLPSKWVFGTSTLSVYSSSWTSNIALPSTNSTSGCITVVRCAENASLPFNATISSNRPYVSTLGTGDYWLFSLPVSGTLPAGTAIEFDATMGGDASSCKYFIVEILDGGSWTSVPADLYSASEDASLKYSYRCSGQDSGSSYEHSSVMQTFTLANANTSGEVRIRCRAVGGYTCSGGSLSTSVTGKSSIPVFGFSGAYVQKFGTSKPSDTKKVLCLGNSFSYYHNPAWLLKEIAWAEGHYLDVQANFKGSQTLGNHLSLTLTAEAIAKGGYDYAFIQDQSGNPALYAKSASENASVSANCKTLSDNIRAASSGCKVVLENTWAYSGSSFGGYTDFATFDGLLASGTKAMAQNAGDQISPIGQAFKVVREGSSGINLYYTDNKHQSDYGAYLKACVNYLVLFGKPFGEKPADCGLNSTKTAYLRSVAEQVVLGHEIEYLIIR